MSADYKGSHRTPARNFRYGPETFWEKGYEKTSMTEIAQAMQVAQGLCYRYFPSKEALFQTCC